MVMKSTFTVGYLYSAPHTFHAHTSPITHSSGPRLVDSGQKYSLSGSSILIIDRICLVCPSELDLRFYG